jgi:hypothetical protein
VSDRGAELRAQRDQDGGVVPDGVGGDADALVSAADAAGNGSARAERGCARLQVVHSGIPLRGAGSCPGDAGGRFSEGVSDVGAGLGCCRVDLLSQVSQRHRTGAGALLLGFVPRGSRSEVSVPHPVPYPVQRVRCYGLAAAAEVGLGTIDGLAGIGCLVIGGEAQ